VIGDMPVARVATDDVLRVLRPIWERVPETASRVRQRIEAVLDAASVKGWRTVLPHPGMLPSRGSVASPECSRSTIAAPGSNTL
jgi:hypothetical protein